MKTFLLLFSMCMMIPVMAYADSSITVNFPSDTTTYSTATNGSGLMGDNGGFAYFSSQGDSISETFFTGQPYIIGLTVDWSLIDYFGGNLNASYENDIYVNNAFVGSFTVDDCGYCANQVGVAGTVNFNPIWGFGTYSLSIVLNQAVPQQGGSEWFTEFNAAGGPATTQLLTPEPSSIALLGSGMLAVAGALRRKISR